MTSPATTPAPSTVRVLVALDIPAAQAADPDDLLASVVARLDGEAGYLDTGDAVTPVAPVRAVIVDDDEPLQTLDLTGIYYVGRGL